MWILCTRVQKILWHRPFNCYKSRRSDVSHVRLFLVIKKNAADLSIYKVMLAKQPIMIINIIILFVSIPFTYIIWELFFHAMHIA